MSDETFYFINKNARSRILSRADPQQSNAVNRHVQKRIRAMRKLQWKTKSDDDALSLSTSTLSILTAAAMNTADVRISSSEEPRTRYEERDAPQLNRSAALRDGNDTIEVPERSRLFGQ